MKSIILYLTLTISFYNGKCQIVEEHTILNFEISDSSLTYEVGKGSKNFLVITISPKTIYWQFSKPISKFIDQIIYQLVDSCFYYISTSEKKIWKNQKWDMVQTKLNLATDETSLILKLSKSYWNRLKTEIHAEYYFNARYWVAENEFPQLLPMVRVPQLLLIDGKIINESIIKSESEFGYSSSVCYLKNKEKAINQRPIRLPQYPIVKYNQAEINGIMESYSEKEMMDFIMNGN